MTDEAMAHRADRPAMSEADQAAFFDAGLACARKAEAKVDVCERFIDVAGATVRLAFAGEALERAFYPALAHLATPSVDRPDATLHVWDSETSGVAAPPAPCGPDAYTDRGDIWGLTSPQFRSAFLGNEYSLNLMDVATGEAIYWVRSPQGLPYWTLASPFRGLFHWLMQSRGRQLLHAAAVATESGGVLIVGRGGVGKSSTALACLDAGFGYVGDDYVVVGLDPEPVAFSLYNTAKLDQDQMRRFPGLAPLVATPPTDPSEKSVFRLFPALGDRLRRCVPLRAILTPRFSDDGATRFEPASVAALSRAAAFTTIAQLPHAGSFTHDFIKRLLERLPGRTIALGPNLNEIAANVGALIADPPSVREQAHPSPVADAPLLSVVIPVHNGARFLAEAVASVLDQAYPRLEIIVVDDGSTVEVELAVRALPVDVRYIRQHHSGAAAARNRGFREASGDLIAFQDVDDLWPQGALDLMVSRLGEDPRIGVVHGYGQLFQRDPESGGLTHLNHPGETFPYSIGAAVFRRSALEAVGLFDESLHFSEDTDWFTRAREQGLVLDRLEQATLLVRRHDENMTRGKSLVEVNALRVLKKALDRRRGADPQEG